MLQYLLKTRLELMEILAVTYDPKSPDQGSISRRHALVAAGPLPFMVPIATCGQKT